MTENNKAILEQANAAVTKGDNEASWRFARMTFNGPS